MELSREEAMCLTAYKVCARVRKRGGVTHKTTKLVFKQFRDTLGVKQGATRKLYKCYFWNDIDRVLYSKEIKEIALVIEAQINLSK